MAKITIYLPDDIERRARRIAKTSHLSVSRWITNQVSQKLNDAWPDEFLRALGSCPDFPSLEDLRSGFGEDLPREPLG